MKVLEFPRGALGWTRLGLLLAAALITGVIIAQDRASVSASHTNIFFTASNPAYPPSTAPAPLTTITIWPAAPPIQKTLYVWVKDVDDSQGLGAFSADIRYDPDHATVLDIDESTQFLAETGRTPSCNPPVIGAVPADPNGWYQAKVTCYTLLAPPPYGPRIGSGASNGKGKLATFVLTHGPVVGTFNMTNVGLIVDTGVPSNPPVDPQVIPASYTQLQVKNVRCGDFNGNFAVAAPDIFLLLTKYGTFAGPPASPGWDPIYDLDGNNSVAAPDIFIELSEFGTICPAP